GSGVEAHLPRESLCLFYADFQLRVTPMRGKLSKLREREKKHPMPHIYLWDIFLSHSHRDKPRVRQLAKRLCDAGLQIWFDEWVIEPGADIYTAIEHGLEYTRTLILCMSQAAFEADWVQMERSTVLFRDPANHERRFIPLLLEDCRMPDTIRRYLYIDW